MEIIIKQDYLKKIKSELNKSLLLLDKNILKSEGFECKLFRLVNEMILIKSCIDNNLLKPSQNNSLDSLKYNLIIINPIFEEIFGGQKHYNFKFPKLFIDQVKDIFFKYSYLGLDFDLVGKLYQGYIRKNDKKKYGQFYTPEPIIDEILDNLKIKIDNSAIFTSTYLDPACGTGSFLVRLVNRLLNIGLSQNRDHEYLLNSIVSNIYGFDIKDFVTHLAKTNLLIQLLPILHNQQEFILSFNIFQTDSLKNLINTTEIVDVDAVINIKQKKEVHHNGFDFIIGNPPYFKAKKLTGDQRIYFKDILIGQQNTYSLFTFLSINLLKENGTLGFIIPESIKSGKYFEALRNYISNKCTITDIVSFNCRKSNFYEALQGVLILCLNKTRTDQVGNLSVNVKNVNNKDYLYEKKFINNNVVKYSSVIRKINNYSIFLVCDSIEEYNVFDTAYENCNYLTDDVIGYKVHTGKLVWNQVKEHLSNDYNSNYREIIWVNNISKYYLSIDGDKKKKNKFCRADGNLANLLCNEEIILLKRTSIKEQADRIIACYYRSDKPYFVENHINYCIRTKKKVAFPIFYLLALLNSNLINFIIKKISGNNQISVTELNLLPIKYNNQASNVENQVLEIMENGLNSKLLHEIDNLINKIYALQE